MSTKFLAAATLAAVVIPVAAIAADSGVVFSQEAFPLSVAPDGRVFGNRTVEVRVSRGETQAGEECRKVKRIEMFVDGRSVATADPGRGRPVCGFSAVDATLRGEIISDKEAREACHDAKAGVTVTPEVEIVFDDGDVSWTADSRDLSVALSCGTGCPPPEIAVPQALAPATAGRFYTATLAISGGYQPLSFSHIEGDLPPGLRLSPGGVISGNPAAPGSFSFTVQAKDSCPEGSQLVRKKLTLRVEAPCSTLSLSGTAALPDATIDRMYSHPLRVTGASAPVRFDIASGELPEGLSLRPDGVVAGRPTTAGISSFTVRVTDSCPSGGRTVEKVFSVTTYDAMRPEARGREKKGEQRKELEALDPLRRTRDEMAGLLVKFDEDVEAYRKEMSAYNARLGGCRDTRYTQRDREQAGCTQDDSEMTCFDKLVAGCLADAPARVEEARRRVRDGAASVRAVAGALEGITEKLK